MELKEVTTIFFIVFVRTTSGGISIDTQKLLVPHTNNDLLHPEDNFHRPIAYHHVYLSPSPNDEFPHHQKGILNSPGLFTKYLKPIFNNGNPLKSFYNNLKKRPLFSPFRINAGISLNKHHQHYHHHHHHAVKPIVEHIDDDLKYDFRTDTHYI